MTSSLWWLCVALALTTTLCCSAQSVPYVDEPFAQLQSQRFTFGRSSPLAQWPNLASIAASSVSQAAAAKAAGSAWLLAQDALWFLDAEKQAVARVDAELGVKISAGARIAAPKSRSSASSDEVLAVAVVDALYVCALTSSRRVADAEGSTEVIVPTGKCEEFKFPASAAAASAVSQVACTGSGDACFVVAGGQLLTTYGAQDNTLVVVSDPKFNEPQTVAVYGESVADTSASVAVAGKYKVWLSSADSSSLLASWRYYWSISYSDEPITSLEFTGDNGSLFIANRWCLYFRNAVDKTFTRIDQRRGLPYNRTTDLSVVQGALPSYQSGIMLWVATEAGVIRYNPASAQDIVWGEAGVPLGAGGNPGRSSTAYPNINPDELRYFYGPRWLPTETTELSANGSSILSISASQSGEDVFALTPFGLTRFTTQPWTLKQKASHYEAMTRPRHDRYGLVADCNLKKFGDLSSYELVSTDNDGLWTSMYLAAECFRYAVTKDPSAKQNAWHSYYAMQLLNNVTGIEGLMARSILPVDVAPSGGTWHNSTTFPQFQWKGDTSSDEVTGHMFVYPIMLELVAETSAEKELVRGLKERIMNYIVKNNFRLIDVTGQPTTWGRWNIEQLNNNITWYDERGLNALQILSWLRSTVAQASSAGEAANMTAAIDYLIEKGAYDENLVNLKITIPDDDNFSDDELAFLPFYTWLFANQHMTPGGHADALRASNQTVQAQFMLGMMRNWVVRIEERASLWNVIYAANVLAAGEALPATLLPDAIWDLKRWPMELIRWPYKNSHRLDVTLDPFTNRGSSRQARQLLPRDERHSGRWNGDPYTLDGGSGMSETDPSSFLLPYWMARYHGLIVDSDAAAPASSKMRFN